MADIKDRRPGGGGASGDTVLYHDEGDGTWSEAFAAHMRSWDPATQTWTRVTSYPSTLKRKVVSLGSSGNVVAAVANKLIKVYAVAIQSASDGMTVQLTDGSGGTALGLNWSFNAREGFASGGAVNPPNYLLATSASTALYAAITGTGTINIEVSYWDGDSS